MFISQLTLTINHQELEPENCKSRSLDTILTKYKSKKSSGSLVSLSRYLSSCIAVQCAYLPCCPICLSNYLTLSIYVMNFHARTNLSVHLFLNFKVIQLLSETQIF